MPSSGANRQHGKCHAVRDTSLTRARDPATILPRSPNKRTAVKGLRFLLGPDEARNVECYRGVRIEAAPGWYGPGFAIVPTYGGCC